MLQFEDFKFLQCDFYVIFMSSFGLEEKSTVLTRLLAPLFFPPRRYIIKCLGLLQRNVKKAKRFPLYDPVSLSQGRRLSGDSSCVRQSCYIGDNAQQELWNVPWSLSETFYQHTDFKHVHRQFRFIMHFVFWIKLQVLLTVYLRHLWVNDK